MKARKVVCLLGTNLISTIGSILMVWVEFYLNITIFGYFYEINNPVPKGVDDLGVGFVILSSLIFSCACAIPVFYFSYRFFHKIAIKYIGGKLC